MTDERLAELEGLCASLPAGDHDAGYPEADGWSSITRDGKVVARFLVELDAEFYCIARIAIPELLAEVRRLRDYHRLTREAILAINLYHQHELGNDLAHRIAELWNRCRCL